MSVNAAQPPVLVSPRTPEAVAADPKSREAAALIARSSVAGVTLALLAAAAVPPQGQRVDVQA